MMDENLIGETVVGSNTLLFRNKIKITAVFSEYLYRYDIFQSNR